MTLASILLSLLQLVVLLTAGLLVLAAYLLYTQQTKLIYPAEFPAGSRTQVAQPHEFGMPDYEDVTLTTPDGVRITGYVIYNRSQPNGKPAEYTLIYLHANAGNMVYIVGVCSAGKGATNIREMENIYGKSHGAPNELGLKIDAQTALDFIQQHPELSSTKLVVYGQSIGAAVAIHLVSKNPNLISGLIIENTFLSMRKLIPHVIPLLKPISFMCHQIWDNERTIEELSSKVPVLFLSGSKDELVPQQHMNMLFQTLKSKRPLDETLVFEAFDNGTHNDTCMQIGYFEAIQEFWKKFVKRE